MILQEGSGRSGFGIQGPLDSSLGAFSAFSDTTRLELGKPQWSFRKSGLLYFGVLTIRILLFRVLYWGPLFFGNSHHGDTKSTYRVEEPPSNLEPISARLGLRVS